MLKQWRVGHPETFTQSTSEVVSQELVEFNNMIADFEAAYSLDELHSIVDLSSDPDRKHPLRDSAKEALKPIFAKLTFLKNEVTIPDEKYEELKIHWKRLSNAVGIINKGIVDHTR